MCVRTMPLGRGRTMIPFVLVVVASKETGHKTFVVRDINVALILSPGTTALELSQVTMGCSRTNANCIH